MISAAIYTFGAAACIAIAGIGFQLATKQRNTRDRVILAVATLLLIFSALVWTVMAVVSAVEAAA